MSYTLEAQNRSSSVKAKQVRKQGFVPCSMYGKSIDAMNIQVSTNHLKNCLKEGHKKMTLNIGKQKFHATVDEVQWNPTKSELLSVSFHAFNQNEKVSLTIPLHFEGKAVGQTSGGVIQQHLQNVTVYGFAKDLPEEITVNLKTLELGSSFHITDIPVNNKYEIKDKTDKVLVTCAFPKLKLSDEEVTAPAAETVTETEAPVLEEVKKAA